MAVTTLSIKGLRGFAEEHFLHFAQPTGVLGSGITVLVGPNNGGKSTVIEALQAWSAPNGTNFSEGKRNKLAGDRVLIRIQLDGNVHELRTVDAGGSEVSREPNSIPRNCYVLPSRRFFRPYFGEGQNDRSRYLRNQSIPETRSAPTNDFSQRLFNALQHITDFNKVLERVVNPAPVWTIDRSDEGGHYLKMNADGQYHNSDGLGEGIVSLLFIVDALYDSDPGDVIVIDEPELSLHPTFQRRLAMLLADYARDRQIIYATHSPYLVDFNHVLNGAHVARVHKQEGSCRISQLQDSTVSGLSGLLKDSHNPHVLGLDAREAFFQEDGVIVVEGQEDVVYYPRVLDSLVDANQLSTAGASFLRERFFGWGAGGAAKIEKIVAVLNDLGFERVGAIFDQNESGLIPDLQSKYPGYAFAAIPADDVRTKTGSDGQVQTIGLLDEAGQLRQEYSQATADVLNGLLEQLYGPNKEPATPL